MANHANGRVSVRRPRRAGNARYFGTLAWLPQSTTQTLSTTDISGMRNMWVGYGTGGVPVPGVSRPDRGMSFLLLARSGPERRLRITEFVRKKGSWFIGELMPARPLPPRAVRCEEAAVYQFPRYATEYDG
jgi:hypothetical protein